jgi:hypothetical protein
MHAYALGLVDETGSLMERVREKGIADRAGQSGAGRSSGAITPPASNTGGKPPKSTTSGPSRGRK